MNALAYPTLDRRLFVQAAAAAFALAHSTRWFTAGQGSDGNVDALVEDNNDFAFALYEQLRNSYSSNIIVSPFSISLALAMTYVGAAGNTATEMENALSFTLDQDEIPAAFAALSADLTERGTGEADDDHGIAARALNIANSVWGEETYPFNEDYLELLSEEFDAAMQLVDFIGAPEEARLEINDWVAEHTDDRIKDIVPEGAITSDARLVLANAIWFYGAWVSQFDPKSTEEGEFNLLDESTVTVPYMRQTESFGYLGSQRLQAVELPYQESNFAFTLIMPERGAFESFEEDLDAALLEEIISNLEWTEIRLSLPSFEFEFGAGLAPLLNELGMVEAFDAAVADFSGMIGDPTADPLFISDVLHKAFITLDEHGTEAAAATVVIMEGAGADPSEPIEVTIDRPFVFVIRDTETGTILFVGRVLSPGS